MDEYCSCLWVIVKVKAITIHPACVKSKRDQNDIAVIETSQHFDFSSKEKVGPICLPGNIRSGSKEEFWSLNPTPLFLPVSLLVEMIFARMLVESLHLDLAIATAKPIIGFTD